MGADLPSVHPAQRMSDIAINLVSKLTLIREHWSPRVIAEMNDVQFKLVKFQGDFVWHQHAETDEVFCVVAGEMQIGSHRESRFAGRCSSSRGAEHITRAVQECHAHSRARGVVNTGSR
jgi:hypothetical protein